MRRDARVLAFALIAFILPASAGAQAPDNDATSAKASRATRDLAPDGSIGNPTDEELKAFLTTVPPPTPAELLKTFETAPGFRMELVAAEPMVRDPIVAAFDEDGNLYVGEMRDYPYNANEPVKVAWQVNRPKSDGTPIGAVRLLRDTDGDGRFDVSHIFADGLLWVGGFQPWKGGVFVTSPPDIWYLKDTDGDGKADIREKVFTGFGTANQQGLLNSLLFGLDHRIYGSTSVNGGEIRPGNDPAAKPISVKGRDFRFDPVSRSFEPQTGTKQFGMSFDDWGNRFLCTQAGPAYHVVLPLRYLERNPHFTPPATIFTAAPSPTPIHRISPIERWRHIRSSRRVAEAERPPGAAGVSHHVIDAAAGVTIYRGGAYPKEYYGNLFVADSVSNLVHRRVPVSRGAAYWTERVDEGTEFVRTANIWFRPVNFVNAPDGTLYCLDMARELSETINIPADVEKHLDLTSGSDRGRIFRIAPPGFRPLPPPRLSRATGAELVAALESPHGWWRDTAHRLLYERQDKSVVPALKKIAAQSDSPQARVHALWSLAGLQSLDDGAIAAGLGASHPGVRLNALRLVESRLDASPALREKAQTLVGDSDPHVRLQMAFAVGESRQWNQAELLARLVRENLDDPWIQSAVLSSAVNCGADLFAALAADARLLADARAADVLRQLVVFIGAQNRSADVEAAVAIMAECQDAAVAFSLVGGLGEGLKRAGTSLIAADSSGRIKAWLRRAPEIARDTARPEQLRRAAIEALALVPYDEAAPGLLAVLASKPRTALQLAAIGTLDQFREPQVGPAILGLYPELNPEGRARAIAALLGRPERIDTLWTGLERKIIGAGEVSAAQVNSLRRHRSERVRERATRFFGAANPAARRDVYRELLPALQLAGDPVRGKAHYEARCAACHRHGGIGFEFGPDLSGTRTGGKEKLLTSIVDPNRDVSAQFMLHTVETKDGETVGGILKDETATTVTLRLPGGSERTLPLANIATRKTLTQSIMPEGLEAGMSRQDVADLIEFILNPSN